MAWYDNDGRQEVMQARNALEADSSAITKSARKPHKQGTHCKQEQQHGNDGYQEAMHARNTL